MYYVALGTDVLGQNIDLSIQLLTFWFLGRQSHTKDGNCGLTVTSWLLLSLLSCNYLINGIIHKTIHHFEHLWPFASLRNNKLFL